MQTNEFIQRVYLPIVKQVNGKKLKEMSEMQRMVLAMRECLTAFNNNSFKEFSELRNLLNEIDPRADFKKMSKMDIIEEQAAIWNLDKNKLIANVKKTFGSN